MQYEIYKINGYTHKRENTLDRVISFYWSDDIDNLHTSFEFEAYDELLKDDWIELYDKYNKTSVFYAQIEEISQVKDNSYKYKGYDYGAIVSQKKLTIQYNGIYTKPNNTVCNYKK